MTGPRCTDLEFNGRREEAATDVPFFYRCSLFERCISFRFVTARFNGLFSCVKLAFNDPTLPSKNSAPISLVWLLLLLSWEIQRKDFNMNGILN